MKKYLNTESEIYFETTEIRPLQSGVQGEQIIRYESKLFRLFINENDNKRKELFPPVCIFWGETINEAESKVRANAEEWIRTNILS